MLTKEEKIKLLAERAADLWIHQMQTGHFDNGDQSSVGGFTFLLATQLTVQARRSLTQDNLSVFRRQLVNLIVEKQGESGGWMSIGTDYGPDEYLARARSGTGISDSVFPVKSLVTLQTADDNEHLWYQFGYSGRRYEQRFDGNTLTEPAEL